ncbi:MAG: hypothetical protein AB1414_00235 [bacterium]
MKKLTKTKFIQGGIVMIILLSNLDLWAQSSQNPLIGKWVSKSDSVTITYTFTENTFLGVREKNLGEFGTQTTSVEGTYLIEGPQVVLTSSDGQQRRYNFSLKGDILNLGGTNYVRQSVAPKESVVPKGKKKLPPQDSIPPSMQKSQVVLVAPDGIIQLPCPNRWKPVTKQEVDVIFGSGMIIKQYLVTDKGDNLYVKIDTDIVGDNEKREAVRKLTPPHQPIKTGKMNRNGYSGNFALYRLQNEYDKIEISKIIALEIKDRGIVLVSKISIKDTEEVINQYSESIDSILDQVNFSLSPDPDLAKMLIGTWRGEGGMHIDTPGVGSVGWGGEFICTFRPDGRYYKKSSSGVSGTTEDSTEIETGRFVGTNEGEETGLYSLIGKMLILRTKEGKITANRIITFEKEETTAFMIGKVLFKK